MTLPNRSATIDNRQTIIAGMPMRPRRLESFLI